MLERSCTSTVSITPPTSLSTWWRSGPTPSCARRTSSSGPTAASSPPGRRSSSRCAPTSSCRASDDIPERFELGTPAYELLAGTTAAVDFLAGLVPGAGSRRERLVASYAALEAHEDRLRARIEEALAERAGVTLHSRAARRTPDPAGDVRRPRPARRPPPPRRPTTSTRRPGSFYAYEASRRLGLGDEGGLRIGLAPYNDDRDVDRLLEALGEYLTRA